MSEESLPVRVSMNQRVLHPDSSVWEVMTDGLVKVENESWSRDPVEVVGHVSSTLTVHRATPWPST